MAAYVFTIDETSFTPNRLDVPAGATVCFRLRPGVKAAHLLLPDSLCSSTDCPAILLTEANPELSRTAQGEVGSRENVGCNLLITATGTVRGGALTGGTDLMNGEIEIVPGNPMWRPLKLAA